MATSHRLARPARRPRSDKREAIYDSLSRLVETPMGALAFMREFADRTEGKPTLKHEIAPARQAIFALAPDLGPSPGPPGAPPALASGPRSIAEVVLTGPNGERMRPI